MISRHFTTTYSVTRSEWTTDGEGNPYSTEESVGTFPGHIQQARAELVQNLGLTLTKSFTVWCPVDADVKAGDTITDGTTTYSVRAAQLWSLGTNPHLKLIVEQDDVEADES
ncbi:MAG: hypothetical protein RLO51_11145 [Thalassobaculum sp.]|uniref:hypothetical protein n=1 Tax=Thalassobaculum sp. TaxID=2022740 RepID=UPI0032EFD03C